MSKVRNIFYIMLSQHPWMPCAQQPGIFYCLRAAAWDPSPQALGKMKAHSDPDNLMALLF
jgi:hypothetical protein